MKGRGSCGEKWKGRQRNGSSICIGAPQWMDLTIVVTPSLNAPPNGPNSPATGRCGFHPDGRTSQRLSLKKAHPTGKKTNRHGDSFRHKVSPAQANDKTSREHRLTHLLGSTVALEYPSQGCLEGSRSEVWLESQTSRSY
jgi:hypothetical protein